MRVLNLTLLLAGTEIARGACTPKPGSPACQLNLTSRMVSALEVLGKSPSDFRLPGSRPDPSQPAGTDLLPGIEHFVMLMMENHSFDNIWGVLDRPDVDVLPVDRCTGKPAAVNAFANGTLLHAYPLPMTCIRTPGTDAPTQNWGSTHVQMGNGTNDGFVVGNGPRADGNKTIAMGYFTPDQLPFTHSLGRIFPVGDRWFTSCPGQTWPNRMYLIGGTSLGITSTGQSFDGTVVAEHHSFYATLDAYNISWRSYTPSWGQPDAEATIRLFPLDNDTADRHGADREQFFADAAAGTLPQYSFIDVNGTFDSQENPQNVVNGEALMARVVQALGASPQWNKTLLIINYDEHGGYYDHVPPPVALAPDFVAPIPPAGFPTYDGFQRYGFRVPAVVVSPYAKKDHVVHGVHDHTSVLALLQRKWNLPALTFRDANANDMRDFIDLEALAAGRPNFPSVQALGLSPPGDSPAALACSAGNNTILPPPEAYSQPGYDFPF
ncbi:hypothetical protein VTK73DRAFT_8810 [Phialemonium thermophilum]|uniref:Phospholipase C n=1 Tax=Phialemonium thermophilum TaxID=223376 RepID=A0ABR3W641_9PEZI